MNAAPSSRREFLRSTATVAAGLSLGLGGRSAPADSSDEKPIRWGVIGAGKRALRAHFPVIRSLPGMEIVAVCDVMDDHLAKGIEAAGGRARGYSDYQRLLADPDVDAVAIATPNFLHAEIVLASLQAGKHVACEKPMAVSVGQCETVMKAAEASDRVLLYTMQFHYSPYYRELQRQIAAGRIGAPAQMIFSENRGDWAANGWLYPDPATGQRVNWRFRHAASGGLLAEEGCHRFDIFHWLMGKLPKSVMGSGGIACYTDGRDTWDHAFATLAYEGGCLATLDMCLFGAARLQLRVMGAEGTIDAEVDAGTLVFTGHGKTEREPIPVPDEIGHGGGQGKRGLETAVVLAYQDFVDCVRNGKKPWMDAPKAMAAVKPAWLAELSAQRRSEVGWDELT